MAKEKTNIKNMVKEKPISDQYLFSMHMAPGPGVNTHWFQMLVASFFTAAVIVITRMASYERPMAQFFWNGGEDQLTDFFSYYKMIAILGCAVLALVLILYRVFTQSFYIKRSFAYLPMAVYALFVVLSYLFSSYKEFALLGWNDRFEGTLTLLAYMVMLFFIINSVNTEKTVKWIVYSIAATSTLLGFLGLSQALGHDFFRTTFGKKLITPSWFWDQIDRLNFIFQNKEIYQTVYNINYVSFYLTLLIPLFGLLFIRFFMLGKNSPVWKKVLWAALFALAIFNLIGSASSGGLLGMAVAVAIAFIVLNKRILEWKIPVAILLAITVIVAGASYNRWMPELSGAVSGTLGAQTQSDQQPTQTSAGDTSAEANAKHTIDYMETSGNDIKVSFDGNEITFTTFPDDPISVKVQDSAGKNLKLVPTNVNPIYQVNDERFNLITVRPAQDDTKNNYIVIGTNGKEWPFLLTDKGVKFFNGLGKLMDLRKVPAIGWENNQSFGSGRGYIWSRTIPMMKETVLLGHGADTYCIYFPQYDYAGKYNVDWNLYTIVDKPHNMYLGAFIGTGGISVLALIILWGIYLIQSFRIYRKEHYTSFAAYAGAGIFLGISGFLFSGLVNDSSVSVMPMFYGLLGTGIAINMMLNPSKSVDEKE